MYFPQVWAFHALPILRRYRDACPGIALSIAIANSEVDIGIFALCRMIGGPPAANGPDDAPPDRFRIDERTDRGFAGHVF